MATTTGKAVTEVPAADALPLSQLLGAIAQQFATAAAAHHASLTYWKQIYENNPLFSDYTPNGMKVVSCQVSLPVAVAKVKQKPVRAAELTRNQLSGLINDEIPKSKRQELAKAIHSNLAPKGKLHFANASLRQDVESVIKQRLPNVRSPVDARRLGELQKTFATEAAQATDVSVFYRHADLERIKPELVLRLNLELKLE